MHCALLGVSKLLLTLWTDTARCSNTDHDIRYAVQQLDDRIKNIKVASSIRRKPRGISNLKHWKGYTYTCTSCICNKVHNYVLYYSVRVQIMDTLLWCVSFERNPSTRVL